MEIRITGSKTIGLIKITIHYNERYSIKIIKSIINPRFNARFNNTTPETTLIRSKSLKQANR